MEATLSRRERERLMRRTAMLEAARAVFAEKGYTHATLDEIAQRAEFGKGTLYNYFEGGKEEILFAILDELYERLHDHINEAFADEVAADRPFRDVFQDFVASFFHFFFERQDQFMILVKEAYRMIFSEEPEKAHYFQHQRERMVDALVPPLTAAMERGEIRRLPPHTVAHMILGNINGYQMHMCLEKEQCACDDPSINDHDDAAAFITTLLLDGLITRPV